MKKYLYTLALSAIVLVVPVSAFAATVTPLTSTNGNFTVTLDGSDPWVAWWTSSGTYISGSDTSGSFSFGSTPGTYYVTTLQDVTQVQHGAYCGEALVTVNTTLSNCTSIPSNSFDAAGGVEWTYTVTAPPPPNMGIANLIASSSAAFASAYGFPMTTVTAWSGTWFLDIIGSGLGVLVQLLPYIIGLAVIGAIVYFLYRAFRFFKH